MAPDLLCLRLRVAVIPDRIAVDFAIDDEVEVLGGALPTAHRRGIARSEIFAIKRRFVKIHVALEHFVAITLRDHRAVPDGHCHNEFQSRATALSIGRTRRANLTAAARAG